MPQCNHRTDILISRSLLPDANFSPFGDQSKAYTCTHTTSRARKRSRIIHLKKATIWVSKETARRKDSTGGVCEGITSSACPGSVCSALPFECAPLCHTLTVLSFEQLARKRLSGDHDTMYTAPTCPVRVMMKLNRGTTTTTTWKKTCKRLDC
jgi:hypothetical protein